MARDPRIDDYIAAQAGFAQPILVWLRDRIHAACPEVVETIKWRMPAFTYGGRPLAHIAAFKAHATLGFWHRDALATGREGEAMGQFGRLTSLADLPDAATIEAIVRSEMALIEAGAPARARPAPKPEAEVPAELAEALAGDVEATKVFAGFPPGCRRDYCQWVDEARRPATRARRAADTVAQLREGKRLNWRHEAR